jgi:putative transposase
LLTTISYRIFPDDEQKSQVENTFGCVRYVYNYYLNEKIQAVKQGSKVPSLKNCFKNLTDVLMIQNPWLLEVDNVALANSLMELEDVFLVFIKERKNNEAIDFPKFKSKHNNTQTYTTNFIAGDISINSEKISLPTLNVLNAAIDETVSGQPIYVLVKKEYNVYNAIVTIDSDSDKLQSKIRKMEKILNMRQNQVGMLKVSKIQKMIADLRKVYLR